MRSLLARGWPLLVLALVVRVLQIGTTRDWTPVADPADYVRNAVSIASGDGMAPSVLPGGGPSAVRPPVYPYTLGLVFLVSGNSETAGRLLAALLGVVSVALIGYIAARLWGERVALVAMAIAAMYPPLVVVSGTLIAESVALPLMLTLLALLVADRSHLGTRAAVIAAGGLLGVIMLTRPALVALAIPVVAVLWGKPARSLRAARAPAAALLIAGLVILPWTIRNAIEFDAFVPISSQSGFLTAGTFNEMARTDPKHPGAHRPVALVPSLRPIVTDRSLDEVEMGRQLSERARTYASEHPGYVVKVFVFNTLRILGLREGFSNAELSYAFQGIGRGAAHLAAVAWWVAGALALVALALGALRRWPWWLWILPPLLCLSVVWISGDLRYRVPIEPFVVWAAGFAVVAVWDRLRGRPRTQPRQPTPAQPG